MACQVRVTTSEQAVPLVVVPVTVTVTFVPQQASTALGGSKLQLLPHGTLLFVAHVITGGVVSTTVTIWLHDALLEQQSVACQVRVTTSEQAVPLVIVPVAVIVTFVPQQTSEAEGVSKLQAEPHWTVLLLEQVMTGGVVSATVTVWVHDALLEQVSVACHVRVITCEQAVPLVVVLRTVIEGVLQPPEAEGVSKVQAEPHWTALLVEQEMATGGDVLVEPDVKAAA